MLLAFTTMQCIFDPDPPRHSLATLLCAAADSASDSGSAAAAGIANPT